jgi:glycosyltransferase involved in cell wall biosynthesis
VSTSTPRVSVVIATYNRAPLLDECLDHLCRQRFAPGDEIIVVDNGSTDDTAAVVARHQAGSAAPLRLLHEPSPGKSHAVARALAAAIGDILAFTDDDVNVADDWLNGVRDAMADPTVALVGGPVEPRWQSTVPLWIRRARDRHPRLGAPIALLDYGDSRAELGARTLLGANLAVRREVFAGVGGFPTHLGKLRGTLLSGEDHELCRRVQDAGFRALYVPQVAVRHWVPADRARVGYFLRWFYWSGITHAVMEDETTAAGGRRLAGVPFYLVRRSATASAAVLAALLLGNWTSALDHALDVAFAIGFAAERWGLTSRDNRAPARVAGETA